MEQSLDSRKSECEEHQHQLHTTQEQVVGLTEQLDMAQQVNVTLKNCFEVYPEFIQEAQLLL